MSDHKIPEIIIQMSTGLSGHIKTATRYWLGLAIISIITVLPTTIDSGVTNKQSTEQKITQIELPYGLGKVNQKDYHPFAVALISILTIGFGSAHCQSIRSRKLVNQTIRKIKSSTSIPEGLDLRDLLAVINTSSIQRTAPIAQILLGKYMFFPEAINRPNWLRLISIFYQLILKIISYLVIYVFPIYALYISSSGSGLFSTHATYWGIPVYFFWLVSGVALILLVQLLILELVYAFQSFKKALNNDFEYQ